MEITYPAARLAAERVQPHFARHFETGEQGQPGNAPLPDAAIIETLIDAAFWASLRREEGFIPRISFAWLPADLAGRPLKFAEPFPLTPEAVTRVAPAVERAGIHLGVWGQGRELFVWGTTRNIPTYCFVLEVVAPGLLVIKHRRGEESAKFVNVAVLEGDQVKVLDPGAATLSGCPAVVASLLGLDSPGDAAAQAGTLTELAVSMRAHGRGGSLLVVPRQTDAWRESIAEPVRYAVSPPFAGLADLMKRDAAHRHEQRWDEDVRRTIDLIAGLTAVDGATILTDDYELLAFGVKIVRRDGQQRVEQALVIEPVIGAKSGVLPLAQIGGTRHLSAAQFAQDQRDAVALVASQDGRFTIFAWSPCHEMVQALRVEALLL
jgi:hypothetical protein